MKRKHPTAGRQVNANPRKTHHGNAVCRVCTIRLERLCYERAWWFRGFREVLATGVRLFALFYRIRPADYITRSPFCYGCLRFKKNALKEQSALFRWLDARLNPVFNRARNSLLTESELEDARQFARDAGDGKSLSQAARPVG